MIIKFQFEACQELESFRLGHSIQGNSKTWKKRYVRPFIPEGKDSAEGILKEIINQSGLSPLEYILCILDKTYKGGNP